MKRAIRAILTNRKTVYATSILGITLVMASLVMFFLGFQGSTVWVLMLSAAVFSYWVSWISNVLHERRSRRLLNQDVNLLSEDIRSLKEILSYDSMVVDRQKIENLKGDVRALSSLAQGVSENVSSLIQKVLDAEMSVGDKLTDQHKRQLEEYRTQAFNHHISIQDLKVSLIGKRDQSNEE